MATDLVEGRESRDTDEFIELVRMPFSGALEAVRDGRVTDGKSVCTLLYAATFLPGPPGG